MQVEGRIVGLAALLEKERTVGAKVEGALATHLLTVGESVASDVRSRYADYSTTGAYGVKARVFTSGLWVVQTLQKSRNLLRRRQNFGPLMFRKAFYPGVKDNENEVLVAARLAVEEVQAWWDSQ